VQEGVLIPLWDGSGSLCMHVRWVGVSAWAEDRAQSTDFVCGTGKGRGRNVDTDILIVVSLLH
jgi:hypothetical protein